MPWEPGNSVITLPDGASLRARGLRRGPVPGPDPEWGLYLLGKTPPPTAWPNRWVRWPDFRLPRDRDDARAAFREAHRLAASGVLVEVACFGGRGRTGTALACIAQLGGVPADEAVGWVREHYDHRAVETPWQKRFARDVWR